MTIQRRKVKTPHIRSVTATAEAGGALSQPAPMVHLQEGEPPPEEAVGGEGDHAEGVAGFELEDTGDELGDSTVGEGERDDDWDGFWGKPAGVDTAEDDGGEAEASESERSGVGDFGRGNELINWRGHRAVCSCVAKMDGAGVRHPS